MDMNAKQTQNTKWEKKIAGSCGNFFLKTVIIWVFFIYWFSFQNDAPAMRKTLKNTK